MVRIDFTEPFPCAAQNAYSAATMEYPGIIAYVPNLQSLVTLERETLEDGRERGLYEFRAKSPLPPVLASIIRPEMLSWKQTLIYDPRLLSIDWTVHPAFFPNHIHCHGLTEFLDMAPGRSRVRVTGEFWIDTLPIPAFPNAFLVKASALLEAVAGRLIEPNLRQFYRAIKKFGADNGLL
jgi:hypothetical protein